jgi:hypothetical protein
MIRYLFWLLLLPLSTNVNGSEIDWGGKIWGKYLGKFDALLEEQTQMNAGGILNLKKSINETITVKFEGIAYRVQSPLLYAPQKDLNSGDFFSEINELNLSLKLDSWNFKIGQLITSWGKSDGLNPTDFLTGKRNILLVTDDQLTRRGHMSSMVEWLPNEGASPWSFQQWIVSTHSETDVLLNQELIGDNVSISRPEISKKIEMATKISYSGQGWDFDYTYFSGVNKTPLYVLDSFNLFPLKLKLTPKYVRQNAHGINLVKDFEDFIVRLETALTHREEIESVDYIRNPNRLDFIAGIERSFYETHRINLQGVIQHYPDYEERIPVNLIEEQIQLLNRFILSQHLQTRLGYLVVYHYEPTNLNQFKFKFSWLNYFHQEDSNLFTPQIEYQTNNNLSFQLYGLLFKGSSNAPFGALEDLSSIGIGANYLF